MGEQFSGCKLPHHSPRMKEFSSVHLNSFRWVRRRVLAECRRLPREVLQRNLVSTFITIALSRCAYPLRQDGEGFPQPYRRLRELILNFSCSHLLLNEAVAAHIHATFYQVLLSATFRSSLLANFVHDFSE